jgi:hypothetical protein
MCSGVGKTYYAIAHVRGVIGPIKYVLTRNRLLFGELGMLYTAQDLGTSAEQDWKCRASETH